MYVKLKNYSREEYERRLLAEVSAQVEAEGSSSCHSDGNPFEQIRTARKRCDYQPPVKRRPGRPRASVQAHQGGKFVKLNESAVRHWFEDDGWSLHDAVSETVAAVKEQHDLNELREEGDEAVTAGCMSLSLPRGRLLPLLLCCHQTTKRRDCRWFYEWYSSPVSAYFPGSNGL
ncbi:hypothetical protein R1flu_027544 [Riccia fluitans]|uniref:Uncharacterized protein n=1 Tax=Riccia fluitans TaxID=41844 RepID=A0ABD1XLZ9_9MARC